MIQDPQNGSIVVLMGIDGTGKSTQATMISAYLRSLGRKKIARIYGGNTAIPLGKHHCIYFSLPIDIVVNRFFKADPIVAKKLNSMLKRLLFLNYFLIVLPKVLIYKKLGYTIIADRYVYDHIISTVVNGLYSPVLSRLLIFATPCPDYIMLLDMNADLTHLRKFEDKSITEIKKSKLLYLAFNQKLNCAYINSQTTIRDVSCSIISVIRRPPSGRLFPGQIADFFDIYIQDRIDY